MSFHAAFYFAASTIIGLILTQTAIESVNGQCTTEGCGHDDLSTNIITEIQQQIVQALGPLNTQTQNIHDVLTASFQQLTSQLNAVMRSLQAVDRHLEEHDLYIKEIQTSQELINESLQEMKSLQAVVQRSDEHDICIKQGKSFHEFLNASFQEIKNQHDTIDKSFQAVDRRLLEQSQSIHDRLNESFQEMKSLQAIDRRSYEHDVCNNEVRTIYEFLNDIKNQTEKSRIIFNDTCDPVSNNALRDCSDIKARGHTANGVYEVCAGHQPNRLCANAYCDMKNGTSLVFQRRKDGSVNFNRTWAEYRDGFGNPDGEFWLGNEILYLLTSKRNYKLRVDLEDWEGETRYAEYTNFSINSSADNYRLTVGGYSGDAGESMSYHNGRQFSTIDANNDEYRGMNCAGMLGGAWWYVGCGLASLNGIYYNRYDTVIGRGINWNLWKKSFTYSLKAAVMKLVPVA